MMNVVKAAQHVSSESSEVRGRSTAFTIGSRLVQRQKACAHRASFPSTAQHRKPTLSSPVSAPVHDAYSQIMYEDRTDYYAWSHVEERTKGGHWRRELQERSRQHRLQDQHVRRLDDERPRIARP